MSWCQVSVAKKKLFSAELGWKRSQYCLGKAQRPSYQGILQSSRRSLKFCQSIVKMKFLRAKMHLWIYSVLFTLKGSCTCLLLLKQRTPKCCALCRSQLWARNPAREQKMSLQSFKCCMNVSHCSDVRWMTVSWFGELKEPSKVQVLGNYSTCLMWSSPYLNN